MKTTDLVLTTDLLRETADGILAFVAYDWRARGLYLEAVLPRVLGEIDRVPTDVLVGARLNRNNNPMLIIEREDDDRRAHAVYLTIPSISVEQLSALRADFMGGA